MSERHIFLGMPGYGQQTAAAGRSFWLACRDATDGCRCAENEYRDKVIREQQIGSLLAANMNKLWARALTLKRRGARIDYFAMLHDDIGVEDYWLDKLIDEMEFQGLDMLGVVSPIKDCRGMTSLALAHPDGDPWHVLCRLSMDEVYRLPPTFTSADVGHPLLLNTGCWVCRFDKFREYPFYFTINDQITFDPDANAYVADVESEDWFFSRLAHQAGMKIGATRKIDLFHEGPTRYFNTAPWGKDKFDASVSESVIPQERKDGFRFPYDVDGWLTVEEGEALYELANGKRVLEIGSYCGKSTICLAQSAEFVVAVDPHDGRGTPKPKNTLSELSDNLVRYGVGDKVEIHPYTSNELPTCYEFDIAFIDGAHDYESVAADIQHALTVLTPDGILAFHDYRRGPSEFNGRWDPGVTQAVNELLSSGAKLLSLRGTVAVVKPPVLVEAA